MHTETDSNIYQVTMTGKELRLILTALDQWGRLRIGQCGDLVEDLALDGDTEEEVYNNRAKFENYLFRRDRAREFITKGLWTAMPKTMYQNDDQSGLAYDMTTFIRHALYIDGGGDPNADNLLAEKPRMLLTNNPEISIIKLGKEQGIISKIKNLRHSKSK